MIRCLHPLSNDERGGLTKEAPRVVPIACQSGLPPMYSLMEVSVFRIWGKVLAQPIIRFPGQDHLQSVWDKKSLESLQRDCFHTLFDHEHPYTTTRRMLLEGQPLGAPIRVQPN